jgi:hypothetical protein
MPDHETGWLVQIQSLRLYRGKLFGIFGAVYYSTESGNSRLYLIEPGLKGEFRILPFYNDGFLLYSKLNLNLNTSYLFSFRYSLQINTVNKWVL